MRAFEFRPWVRRAGLSILLVAAGLTALVAALAVFSSDFRYGWVKEPFVAIYLLVLWAGGVRVTFATLQPVAMIQGNHLVLRPLHLLGMRRISWDAIQGTEQMLRGDRLIIYFLGARGVRYVALNLNLVRGRREFMRLLEERLTSLGFVEKITGQSRYLSKTHESKNGNRQAS